MGVEGYKKNTASAIFRFMLASALLGFAEAIISSLMKISNELFSRFSFLFFGLKRGKTRNVRSHRGKGDSTSSLLGKKTKNVEKRFRKTLDTVT